MTTRIISFADIDSTNAEARRRAEAGEAGPLWITAARQTAGRGRRGRVWETETGNLAATYLFTTAKPPGEAAQVSFVAALAAYDLANTPSPLEGEGGRRRGTDEESRLTLHHLASGDNAASRSRDPSSYPLRGPPSPAGGKGIATLKWPNDLLLNGRKAGGILVESGQALAGLWVAVGIGINLKLAPEPAPEASIAPTSFRGEGVEPPTPAEALACLDRALQHWLDVWDADGFPPIATAWTTRAHGLGQTCSARLPAEAVTGIAEGLDGDGALRLRLPGGTVRRITAGDVFFTGAD